MMETAVPGGDRTTLVLRASVLSVAVTVANAPVLTAETAMLKAALLAPAFTVIDAGIVIFRFALESPKLAPAEPTGVDSATVQTATAGVTKFEGVH